MKLSIGISEKNLNQVATLLTSTLSDEMVLYVKTRNFHWNVSGESFMELHKLFEGQYNELEKAIDEVAERIGKLGRNTIGTMKEFTENSRLKETPGSYPAQKDMLKQLLADHESLITHLRADVDECADNLKDAGTADFLTGLMEKHETMAWILRRYLN
jgi:starvation-inducible DNA-binding protein